MCFGLGWLLRLGFRKLTTMLYLYAYVDSFCGGGAYRLYDQITEEAPEYYLYQAELQLLKTHSREIATQMGFPSPSSPSPTSPRSAQGSQSHQTPPPPPRQDDQPPQHDSHSPRVGREDDGETDEKWGDVKVGRWNGGVNAEEGLDGERENKNQKESTAKWKREGWDIVELGAG
jgi:hypothetical protein